MRRGLNEALFIARHRRAFGKHLIDMPLMQKQLLKMMLLAEQARSMFMQIATLLPRADGGDARAQKCVRILTPLIKFRACRDARRVTGDAMEVRGGVGYIEEWSDPRLVRDAHLGSIWEGTSNIVALDIARAVTREQALEPLHQYLRELLEGSGLPESSRTLFESALERTVNCMRDVAEQRRDEQVRQAGSALYHICTAIFMAWEAGHQAPDYRRLALAHLLLEHKLLPRDPLRLADWAGKAELLARVVGEASLSQAEAMQLLPA
ncbi:putative acyl-CoA dehydrogenase AidB [compost metagenome]